MNKTLLYLSAAALLLSACAKTPSNVASPKKAAFEAWVSVHCPNAKRTPLGSYILEDQPGSGAVVGDSEQYGYLRVNYTASYTSGKITGSTLASVNQQIGSYNPNSFYGPKIWDRVMGQLYLGVEDGIRDMKLGGRRKILIPSWLLTTVEQSTEAEYIAAAESGSTDAIYDIEVVDAFNDIARWELDSLSRYISAAHPSISPSDSLKLGFYYIQTKAPDSTKPFPQDTTIYINYTGRLLNGHVFDTTIRDTAKMHGIYSDSRKYEPVQINWDAEDYTKITMSSSESTVVDGFSYALSQMHSHEAATAIFYSALGYKEKGSSPTIPEYSPLIFEIEIVDKK